MQKTFWMFFNTVVADENHFLKSHFIFKFTQVNYFMLLL